MIRLNVFIQANEGQRAELLSIIKELVAKSLTDKGCIAYDVFESSTRPEVLMICETWTDEETLAEHEKAQHFLTLVPKMGALSKTKIEKFAF